MKRFLRNYSELVIFPLVALSGFVALTASAVIMSKVGCESRWSDSGRSVTWGIMAGCRVSDHSGNLIPERNIRAIK